jgi:hypothetical protein
MYKVTYRLKKLTLYTRKADRDLAIQVEKHFTKAYPDLDVLRDKLKISFSHPSDMAKILEDMKETYNMKQISSSQFRLMPPDDYLANCMMDLLCLDDKE